MSFRNSESAAMITAAVLAQHTIPLTAEGAEKVAMFHKHIVFFLDLHLPEPTPEAGSSSTGTRWPTSR